MPLLRANRLGGAAQGAQRALLTTGDAQPEVGQLLLPVADGGLRAPLVSTLPRSKTEVRAAGWYPTRNQDVFISSPPD